MSMTVTELINRGHKWITAVSCLQSQHENVHQIKMTRCWETVYRNYEQWVSYRYLGNLTYVAESLARALGVESWRWMPIADCYLTEDWEEASSWEDYHIHELANCNWRDLFKNRNPQSLDCSSSWIILCEKLWEPSPSPLPPTPLHIRQQYPSFFSFFVSASLQNQEGTNDLNGRCSKFTAQDSKAWCISRHSATVATEELVLLNGALSLLSILSSLAVSLTQCFLHSTIYITTNLCSLPGSYQNSPEKDLTSSISYFIHGMLFHFSVLFSSFKRTAQICFVSFFAY